MAEPEIVLKFTPATPGDHLRGIPARDLTAEEMANIEPFDLRNMTLPGPSGTPMYTYADPERATAQRPPEPPAGDDDPAPPAGDNEPKTPAARRAGATNEEKSK